MLWIRRPYLKYKKGEKERASALIQRYLKGYEVSKKWRYKLHNFMIDNVMAIYRPITLKLHTDSQIKI